MKDMEYKRYTLPDPESGFVVGIRDVFSELTSFIGNLVPKRSPVPPMHYPLEAHCLRTDNGERYWVAILPDFRSIPCLATGVTIEDAVAALRSAYEEVAKHYLTVGDALPSPSGFDLVIGRDINDIAD